jgi:hypothetical protein
LRSEARACRTVVAAALGALLASTGGCSWIFTKPLPDNWRNYDQLDCSTNPVPPLIDGFLFLSNAGTTVYVAAFENTNEKVPAVAVGALAATLWLSSAIYGFSRTNACHEALGDSAHGYHPPAFGTGGEVFGAPPPAKRVPSTPGAAPAGDDEDPGHPKRPARARPGSEPARPDAPRFGG